MGHDFYFDESSSGQSGDLHRGTSGWLNRKGPRVDLIHGGKVSEAGQEDGGLDDMRKGQALILKNQADVLKHPLCLSPDVSFDQTSRSGVQRDLTGAEQEIANADGVAVWTNRRGGGGWLNDVFG